MEYAQHRGFIPDPTRVRHPKNKPHVEREVSYVRERFFKGGQFASLLDLRSQACYWCLKVLGQRLHGTTRKLPLVVFREVRLDSKLVRVNHRGSLVKLHPRQPKGGRSTDPDDYPPELSAYTLRAPDRVKRQAAELGPAVAAFTERLFAGPLPWSKLRQGHKLLRLGERYGAQRLEWACQRALAVDLIDVRRLERILVEALEEEAAPVEAVAASPPPGRFTRPGSAFTHTNGHDCH